MLTRRAVASKMLRNRGVRRLTVETERLLSSASGLLRSALALEAGSPTLEPPSVGGLVLVELMGPSGVGKTTLGRALIASQEAQELLRPAGGLVDSGTLSLPKWSSQVRPSRLDALYSELLRRKATEVTSRGSSAAAVTHLMSFFSVNLLQDTLINASHHSNNVLCSDGVLHNFGAQLAEIGRDDELAVRDFLSNRVILLCTAPPEVIAERALQRESSGGHRPQFFGRSSQEVREYVHGALERVRRSAQQLGELDAPVVEVDMTNPEPKQIASALLGRIAERRSNWNGGRQPR
jgi:hypothetical protein